MALSDFWFEMLGDADNVGFVETIWPEVRVVFRATQAVRQNWANVLDEARKRGVSSGPWIVVDMEPGAVSQRGAAQTFAQEYPVGIWYVKDTRAPDSGGSPVVTKDVMGTLEAKAELMATAINSHSFSSFQTFEPCMIDASRTNEANGELLETNMGVLAVCVTFRAMIGETIVGLTAFEPTAR